MNATSTDQQTWTWTISADAVDHIRHLYCASPHHARTIGQEQAFCGARRNMKPTGTLLINEAEQQGYCVVCIDLVKHQGTLCHTCKKGKK